MTIPTAISSSRATLLTGVGDRYAVESDEAQELVSIVAERFGVAEPELTFNRRRRRDTGQCWAPRRVAVEQNGESRILAWERHHRRAYRFPGSYP